MSETLYDIPPCAKGVLQNLLSNGTTLTAAIAELLDNAVTANAKHVKLTLAAIDGQYYLIVADDGIGMDKNKLISIQKSYQSRKPVMEGQRCVYKGAGRFGVGYAAARAVLTNNSGTTIIMSHHKPTPAHCADEHMYDMLGFAKCSMTLDMNLEQHFMKVCPGEDLGEECSLWEKYSITPREKGTIFAFPLTDENVDEMKRDLFSENLRSNMALVFADRYSQHLSGEYYKSDQPRVLEMLNGEGKDEVEPIKLNMTLQIEESNKVVSLDPIPTAWDFAQKDDLHFKRKFTFKRLKEPFNSITSVNGKKVNTTANMAIYDHSEAKHSFILEHQDIGNKGKKKHASKDVERDWIQYNMADQELLQVSAVHIGELENFINYLRPVHEKLGIKVPTIPLQRNKNGKIVHDSRYPFDELFRPKLARNGYKLTLDKREKAEQTHEVFRTRTIYEYSFLATPERDEWMAVEINKMRSSRKNMKNCIIAGMYQTEAAIMEGRLKNIYKEMDKPDTEASSGETDNEDEEDEQVQAPGLKDGDFLMGSDIATAEDDVKAVKNAKKTTTKVQAKKKTPVVVSNVRLGSNEFTTNNDESSEESDDDTYYHYSEEELSDNDDEDEDEADSVTISSDLRVVEEYVADNGLKASEVIHALERIREMSNGSTLVAEVCTVLNKVHMALWNKFIIAKGRESYFNKWYKEHPLPLNQLFESIIKDISEFYNNDRGVLGGADIKALYKKLEEEANSQLEEDNY